ncbi:unnamed protein product [Strongylus vulgaris]|uniref:DNTTIP1 dimerisation domain-containing protein n=1 Tax=Strongylus vulgaris TaxID=40348 RepID=A0A3P7J937_STRVU|nr:unnamed protein product [Strongylus vulgaris]
MFDKLTGNGNGNKMNMRVHILEGILSSIETDGSSARVNSLRQVIRRNKADMADDAGKSLDLMRRVSSFSITMIFLMSESVSFAIVGVFQIFQNEITKELQQIMDRHIRTTFSPAIENLKKNGHVVDQDVINDLYTSILDAAKAPFMRDRASTMNRDRLNSERSKVVDQDVINDLYTSILDAAKAPFMRDRASTMNRDRLNSERSKDEEPSLDLSPFTLHEVLKWSPERHLLTTRYIPAAKVAALLSIPVTDEEPSLDLSPFTLHEVLKWSPERHLLTTRYIPAAKVAALLSIPVTVFFSKYPRMFRVC